MAVSLTTQIMSPILLLVGTFLFGISPIAVTRFLLHCECNTEMCKPSCRARKGKMVTSFLIYFGGGVLLATCLVHLLPETRERFEYISEHTAETNNEETKECVEYTRTSTVFDARTKRLILQEEEETSDQKEHQEKFPLPEFMVCCGFFAVYLLEEIIHFALGEEGHSHTPRESRAMRLLPRSNSGCSVKLKSYMSVGDPSHLTVFKSSDIEAQPPSTAASVDPICQTNLSSSRTCSNISISGLLTVVALSFHSLFEGFAIGIQNSTSRVWILFAALAVHKFVIAFVVGVEVLAEGGKYNLVIIYMTVFALMSPLGMIIAFVTQESVDDSNPLLVGVLNAIATGTLLYITFWKILQGEGHKNLTGWQEFSATFLGFGVMCFVQYLTILPW